MAHQPLPPSVCDRPIVRAVSLDEQGGGTCAPHVQRNQRHCVWVTIARIQTNQPVQWLKEVETEQKMPNYEYSCIVTSDLSPSCQFHSMDHSIAQHIAIFQNAGRGQIGFCYVFR